MTFVTMQDRVMARLNWTSDDHRELVKFFLNERYRDVCASVGLAPTRRTTLSVSTTQDNPLLTLECAKIETIFDAATLKRPLQETTVADIRSRDAAADQSSSPTHYAIYSTDADSVTVMLWPTPPAAATLKADVIANGTDLSADGDEPAIPADFHDALTRGALADGYLKIDKMPLAEREEKRFEQRVSELRYFLATSAWLRRFSQDSHIYTPGRKVWPYTNLG